MSFFPGLQAGSCGFGASCCAVRLEIFLRLLGGGSGGLLHSRAQSRFSHHHSQSQTTFPRDHQHLFAPRHDLLELVELCLAPHGTGLRVSILPLQHAWEEELATLRTALHSTVPKQFFVNFDSSQRRDKGS